MSRKLLLLAVLPMIVSGCMADTQRVTGVTSGAGNAIAANTAMQMVDPWQPGVDDTDLMTPANRAGRPSASATAAAPAAGATLDK